MRKIQTAFSCQKQFSSDRWHRLIERDTRTRSHRCFSGHESGWASTDDDDLHPSVLGNNGRFIEFSYSALTPEGISRCLPSK